MTPIEKLYFIDDLIKIIRSDIVEAIAKMPEDWDGHELRRFIADKFDAAAMTVGRKGQYGKPYAKRTRAYRNYVLVNNL